MGCGSSNDTMAITKTHENERKTSNHHYSYYIKENQKQVKDNYTIKNRLGEGKFGIVRRIIDKTTGEEKALKIIQKNKKDKDQERKIVSEIETLKQLDHPSILKMYEFYQDKQNYYIVTEMIKGGELFDKIVDLGSFSEYDAAYVFNQLISVVQYIHEKRIMHRDLKPDNILLEHNPKSNDTKFSIKVIDWGTAIPFSEKKDQFQTHALYYVSPEQFKKNYTEKCDIWTCGVILYIMLTGEPPFYGNDGEIINSIKDVQFEMDQDVWKGVSKECKDIINQMICFEDKRLTAQQVQEHPWVKKFCTQFKDDSKDTAAQKEQYKLQLNKLKRFSTKNQFHQAVLTYMSTQLTSKQDLQQFKTIFEKMDKNNDGSLTKEEIEQGFIQFQEYFHGDYDIEKIFQSVDLDGNGKINYSEFIVASLKQEANLIEYKLQRAFEVFDIDGNKNITKDELKEIFGKQNNNDQEKQIQDILNQFDQNGDGNINFEEFKIMMKKYAENM